MAAASLSERQESRERIPAVSLRCTGGKVDARKVFEEMPFPARASPNAAGGLTRHPVSMGTIALAVCHE